MTATTAMQHTWARHTGPFSGELYRFHGLTVMDRDGDRVGIVDWIWTDESTGEGDYIGLQLQWLRGRARAVPATNAILDRDNHCIHLPFSRRQIDRAPRFRIDRALSADQQAAIAAHYTDSSARAGAHGLTSLVA